MSYALKEIYVTLQGEGAQAGRAAIFARFVGCNLWSGKELDRASAACWFCDTDFVGTDGPGGGRFPTAAELAAELRRQWDLEAGPGGEPYVVFTGGEPLLQLDVALIDACHDVGISVGVETNGTLAAPAGIDWLCVSPKPNSELVIRAGDELKLVFPHEVRPEDVEDLEFRFRYLQPLDWGDSAAHVAAAVEYVRRHPAWRLSLQTHKLIGIP